MQNNTIWKLVNNTEVKKNVLDHSTWKDIRLSPIVISARLIITQDRLKSQQKYNSRTLFQGSKRKFKKVYNANAVVGLVGWSGIMTGGFMSDW